MKLRKMQHEQNIKHAKVYNKPSSSGVVIPLRSHPSSSTGGWRAYEVPTKSEVVSREGKKMSEPTREEFDAKLGMVEARLDVKLAGIEGKLDRLSDQIGFVLTATNEAKAASFDARQAASNVKWNIAFTALAVIAVILALWGVWVQGVEMVETLLGALPAQ